MYCVLQVRNSYYEEKTRDFIIYKLKKLLSGVLMHFTGQSVYYKVKRFQVLPTLNQASSRAQILEKKGLRSIFSIIVHFKWPKWPISVRCSFCKRYGYNGSGCEFFSISHSKSQNLFICYWVQSFHALGQKCYLL